MTQDRWTSVDNYLASLFLPPDPVLDAVLRSAADAGLPGIHVSPMQGKFLHLLARVQGAGSILEIGTLAGYSTIWLGRALAAGGRLITLEANEQHAQVARANIVRAGLASAVELILGPASQTLRNLISLGQKPFDLIFIDADKTGYPEYLELCLQLSRPGTLIIADNVIRKGEVMDPQSQDPNVQAVRRFNELVAGNPRLAATAIQTVGSKGYDGFAMMVVKG
jgi:predicted O-methyltransferase YrrM